MFSVWDTVLEPNPASPQLSPWPGAASPGLHAALHSLMVSNKLWGQKQNSSSYASIKLNTNYHQEITWLHVGLFSVFNEMCTVWNDFTFKSLAKENVYFSLTFENICLTGNNTPSEVWSVTISSTIVLYVNVKICFVFCFKSQLKNTHTVLYTHKTRSRNKKGIC